MTNYLFGLLKNLFNPAVSLFAIIDRFSIVDKKAKVYSNAKLFRSTVGAYTYITHKTRLANVEIGKFCSIADDCIIGLGGHTISNLSTSPIFTQANNALCEKWTDMQEENLFLPIIIGNDVWIGSRATIMSGIKIGDGAVVGAGAVVTHDVPPYAIVAGVPAKIIRFRFSDDKIAKLEEIKWWDWSDNKLKDNIALFQKHFDDDFFIQLDKIQQIK